MINKKIKQLYGTKAKFCEKTGHKYKDLASKIRTAQSKLDWLNRFIEPLGLRVEIFDALHLVGDLDTSAFKVGDVLGLDPTKPGGLVKVDPEKVPFVGELLMKVRNNTGAPLSGAVAFPIEGSPTPYNMSLSRPMETPGWCLNRGGCADQYCRKQDSASTCPVDSGADHSVALPIDETPKEPKTCPECGSVKLHVNKYLIRCDDCGRTEPQGSFYADENGDVLPCCGAPIGGVHEDDCCEYL